MAFASRIDASWLMLNAVVQSKDGNPAVSEVDLVAVGIPRLCQRVPWALVALVRLRDQVDSEADSEVEVVSVVVSAAIAGLVDEVASDTKAVGAGLVPQTEDHLQMLLLVLVVHEAVVTAMEAMVTGAMTTDLDIAEEAGMTVA